MHVEERLRQGLEANATSFAPAGEWRLAMVRRRRRRRSMALLAATSAAAVVIGSALLAGRGGELVMLPGPSPAAVDPPARAYDGPVVPDGTWHRVATEAEAASLGVTSREIADRLGSDGRLPLALTVMEGTWAVTTTSDGGGVAVGDFGRATYDEQGRLVTASASTRCPGCEAVLIWRVESDDLVLESAGDRLGAAGRPVTEGRWRDREPLTSTWDGAGGCSSTRGRATREEETMDRNTVVALSVLATLAAACSDDVSEGATTPGDPSSHQASDSSGVRAPESGWVREATADRARALGLPARTIARYVGEDGVLPLGFKLQQQTYAIYVMDDAGDASTYDIGGYSYDDHGRIMLSSSSARCSDCDTALGWQQDGDRMVIDEVSGPRATPLDQLVWEGAWTEYTGD